MTTVSRWVCDSAFAGVPSVRFGVIVVPVPLIEPDWQIYDIRSRRSSHVRPPGACGTVWELDQAVQSVRRGFRKTFVTRSPLLGLITEPRTRPHSAERP